MRLRENGAESLVCPPHPGLLGRAIWSRLQEPGRGKGQGRTLGRLDLEPALHLPDRMSVGTATPVITGCGAGQALRQLFIHLTGICLFTYAVLTVQGPLLIIVKCLLDIVLIQPTFIPCSGE